jgi:TRAP-type transport system small permease protein
MQARSAFVGRWLEYLCAALLIAVVLIIFTNVVARYFFSAPIRGSDELSQYVFLWLSYLGALAALMRGRHYSFPNLVEMLPSIPGVAVKTLRDIIVLLMLAVLVWFGWQLVDRLSYQTSPALGLPVYYAYFALPLTSALMAAVVCGQMINRLRGVPPVNSDDTGSDRLDERP